MRHRQPHLLRAHSETGRWKAPSAATWSTSARPGSSPTSPRATSAAAGTTSAGRSVCIHCSLGCGLVTSARYRQVARQEARFHPAVNGWFVCDRGRHGFHYASLAERPRQARVQAERAGFDDALAHGRERLAAVQAAGGPRSVALVASARGSLETLAAAAALARTRGWRGPAVFAERSHGPQRCGRARTPRAGPRGIAARNRAGGLRPRRRRRPAARGPHARAWPCGRPRAPGPRW